jgi:alkanesulfonate monooxygenase SsuD/methylene tetrahydromethanopterin reductase-like flavin-dependent oxidoreductase (luciferase family)
MDECLQILRALESGEPTSFEGEFFSIRDALILPAPAPPIPLVIGGRSDAAARRAARFGDGWLGIWVSPRRFATAAQEIADEAGGAGRDPNGFEHALNVWCGFGASREDAREPLAAGMQGFYQMPFEPFERVLALRITRRRCGIPARIRRRRLHGLQRDPVRSGPPRCR